MATSNPGQPFDSNAAFKREREAYKVVQHEWIADKAEKQLLGSLYPSAYKSNGTEKLNLSR